MSIYDWHLHVYGSRASTCLFSLGKVSASLSPRRLQPQRRRCLRRSQFIAQSPGRAAGCGLRKISARHRPACPCRRRGGRTGACHPDAQNPEVLTLQFADVPGEADFNKAGLGEAGAMIFTNTTFKDRELVRRLLLTGRSRVTSTTKTWCGRARGRRGTEEADYATQNPR